MARLGPYSRASALAKLDGRTREARLLRVTREELLRHLGHAPSSTQRMLVEQAAQIALRLATMDRKFAESGAQTELDSRTYLAWANSYTRLLRQIGLKAAPERPVPFHERLAAREAAQRAGASTP